MILDFLILSITYSAGYLVTGFVTSLSIISFILHKHSKRILPLLISVLGTASSVYFLKNFFALERPEGALYIEKSFTFPSGHSAIAMALYGFLLHTVWHHDKHHLKKWLYPILILLILSIGLSRIYLGVHYVEDVVMGYIIGFIWLLISIKFHKYLHTRK